MKALVMKFIAELFSLINNKLDHNEKKNTRVYTTSNAEQVLGPEPKEPELEITVEDVITASGRYPERMQSTELTPEVLNNIENFLKHVIPFLKELGVLNVNITSGFRPIKVNQNIDGGGLHPIGFAIDIADANGQLKEAIRQNAEKYGKEDLLHKYNLWMEKEAYTPTWCHIDMGKRRERKIRIFIP